MQKSKSLSDGEKNQLVSEFAQQLKENFKKAQSSKKGLSQFIVQFGKEKDWPHLKEFCQELLSGKFNSAFMAGLSQTLFAILDDETAKEKKNQNVTATTLALMTELSMLVKSTAQKSNALTKQDCLHYIENVTSNMLSRANIHNDTFRMGLVYYLTHIEKQSNSNIDKILNRFGQNILNNVLEKYFCESEKSNCALAFIMCNLDKYLFYSPSLAEMGNAVLKNKMLKYPKKFPVFLKNYVAYKLKNGQVDLAKSLTIHLSFFLKEACEINNKELIHNIHEIIFSYISTIEGKNKGISLSLFEFVGEIISTGKSQNAKEISRNIYNKMLENKKIFQSANHDKLIHFDFKNTNIYKKLKLNFDSREEHSPLDEILLLARA